MYTLNHKNPSSKYHINGAPTARPDTSRKWYEAEAKASYYMHPTQHDPSVDHSWRLSAVQTQVYITNKETKNIPCTSSQ